MIEMIILRYRVGRSADEKRFFHNMEEYETYARVLDDEYGEDGWTLIELVDEKMNEGAD